MHAHICWHSTRSLPCPTRLGVLRFDAGGGRACRNAAERSSVTLVFPPADHSDGMSLVVDGVATVDASDRRRRAFLGRAPPTRSLKLVGAGLSRLQAGRPRTVHRRVRCATR